MPALLLGYLVRVEIFSVRFLEAERWRWYGNTWETDSMSESTFLFIRHSTKRFLSMISP